MCLAFSLSKNTNGSDGRELKSMATNPEVTGSNPRLCKMFLKQRSKRASNLLWPKRRFFKCF